MHCGRIAFLNLDFDDLACGLVFFATPSIGAFLIIITLTLHQHYLIVQSEQLHQTPGLSIGMAFTHRMLEAVLVASTVAAASLRFSSSSHAAKSPQIAHLPDAPQLPNIVGLPDVSEPHSLPEALSSNSSNSLSKNSTDQDAHMGPSDPLIDPHSLTSSQRSDQKRDPATGATLTSMLQNSYPLKVPLPRFLMTMPSPGSSVGEDSGAMIDEDPADGTSGSPPWGDATTSNTNPYTEVPDTGKHTSLRHTTEN